MKKIEIFPTQDLHLASYLISAGLCKLEQIDYSNDTWKQTFILSPKPDDTKIDKFYGGSGRVSALKLCDTMRSLKAAVKTRKINHV